TAFQVVSGLYEVYRIDSDANIPPYIASSWNYVLPLFQAMGQTILQSGLDFYDGFGQYLKFAAIASRMGVDAYQGSFTIAGVASLFDGQTLSYARSTCGGMAMTYGGWPHSRTSDCTQYIGYHRFIIEGLVELYRYLLDANACFPGS